MRRHTHKLFAAALVTSLHAADAPLVDDVEPQVWRSPDGQLSMHHGLSSDLRSRADAQEALALTSYTLTDRAGAVLWSGTSWADSSAHSFRCVWSEKSSAAVLLDRPMRAEVQVILVRAGKPAFAEVLDPQPLLDQVFAKARDNDVFHLQKAWFGEWRFERGRFQGIIIATRQHYHRLLVSINPSAPVPILELLKMQHAEKWDDAMEKLK